MPHLYAAAEHCVAMIDGHWRKAIVMEKKGKYPKYIYNLMFPDERDMESGENKFRDVPHKNMSRAQVYVCVHCGNWIDPAKLPVLRNLDGSTAEIVLGLDLLCRHGSLPYKMDNAPWNEVPGVSAIGGLHSTT